MFHLNKFKAAIINLGVSKNPSPCKVGTHWPYFIVTQLKKVFPSQKTCFHKICTQRKSLIHKIHQKKNNNPLRKTIKLNWWFHKFQRSGWLMNCHSLIHQRGRRHHKTQRMCFATLVMLRISTHYITKMQ